MIVIPRTPEKFFQMAEFMRERVWLPLSSDLRMIGWESDGLAMVVGFNVFVGKTCQMNVAMREGYHYTPKAILRACSDYVFDQLGCEAVFATVNSKNERSMRYNIHLGFREVLRRSGMHDDGGDLVLFEMRRDECRWRFL